MNKVIGALMMPFGVVIAGITAHFLLPIIPSIPLKHWTIIFLFVGMLMVEIYTFYRAGERMQGVEHADGAAEVVIPLFILIGVVYQIWGKS